jgi:hypothetical protein
MALENLQNRHKALECSQEKVTISFISLSFANNKFRQRFEQIDFSDISEHLLFATTLHDRIGQRITNLFFHTNGIVVQQFHHFMG